MQKKTFTSTTTLLSCKQNMNDILERWNYFAAKVNYMSCR